MRNLASIFQLILPTLNPGPVPRGHLQSVPLKRVTVPPTFHPLPSLLNVIDFESESETHKTAHIRKQLHALASVSNSTQSQMARFPPEPTPSSTFTHNVIPEQNIWWRTVIETMFYLPSIPSWRTTHWKLQPSVIAFSEQKNWTRLWKEE